MIELAPIAKLAPGSSSIAQSLSRSIAPSLHRLPMAPPCCFEKVFQSCFPHKADDHEPTLLEKLGDALGINKFAAYVIMDGSWIGGITDKMVRTPSAYGMDFEEVRFKAMDGCNLAGWYIPAKDKGSNKLAIVGHQSWACANKSGCITHHRHGWVRVDAIDYVKLHKVLYDAGYHVFAYDLRNHGDSEKRLPSGFGEIEYMDAVGVIDWVNSHAVLKNCKVAMLPFCVSGISFFKANSLYPEKFKNVFAWVTTNTFHGPVTFANRPYMFGMGNKKLLDKAFADKQAWYEKQGLLKAEGIKVSADRISAKNYAPDVKVPVLWCDVKHDFQDFHEMICPEVFAEFGKGLPEELKKKNELHFLGPNQPKPFTTRGRNRSEGYNFYQSEEGSKVLLSFLAKHCPWALELSRVAVPKGTPAAMSRILPSGISSGAGSADVVFIVWSPRHRFDSSREYNRRLNSKYYCTTKLTLQQLHILPTNSYMGIIIKHCKDPY